MLLQLAIETHDRTLGFQLAGAGSSLRSGTIIHVPGGTNLEYQGTLVRKARGIPEVLQFVVDASINADLALLATWLYDKVKDKPVERIIVNRRVITEITEITEDQIRQVVEEETRSGG